MSWAKGTLAGMALGAACLSLTPQVAEAGVVVSSSGPSAGQFPVGRQIDDSERFSLQDGDTLTVLNDGGTRVFRGSGTYMLSQSSGSSRNRAFASLTSQRSASRARTGAVRGTNVAAVSNPNLWYVDVTAPGTICISDPANVRLWRGDTQAESTYSITSEGSETTVTFPAGEMLAAWDIYNPPETGTTYNIGLGSNAVEVRFVVLEETPESAEDMANVLISNGCMVQLEQMSSAMMGG